MINSTTTTNTISNKHHAIRGLGVMLSRDFAELLTAEAKIKIFQNDIFLNENKLFWYDR